LVACVVLEDELTGVGGAVGEGEAAERGVGWPTFAFPRGLLGIGEGGGDEEEEGRAAMQAHGWVLFVRTAD
jgi:hypothetical protein